MFLSVSSFRRAQDKNIITIMGGYKLIYVLSVEIMTLTLKVIILKSMSANISETGLDA